MAALLCMALFLSGMAGLIFESLWFYQAGLALGNSVWASSLVLAAFMGGLGLGNGLAGRFGHRVHSPIRLYAGLEVVIGLTGIALVHLVPVVLLALVPVLRASFDSALVLNGLRLAIGFCLLVVPAAAMGATMPFVVAALSRRQGRFGEVLGRLYGWNTLGAVVGALAGEAFLIEAFGIRGTALVAGLANAAAALIAIGVSRRVEGPAVSAPPPAPRALPGRARVLLFVAFLSGATLLALEVVWFRFLLLVVTGTGLAFAVMLAVVLAGIALGGFAASRWLRWDAQAVRHLPSVAALGGILCVVSYAVFGDLPRSFEARAAFYWSEMAEVGLPLMLPVSLLSGVLFTLLGEALQREAPGETRAAGFLTLANTAGAMLGSLLAGFVLLPGLGVEDATWLLSAVYGGIAGLLWIVVARRGAAALAPARVAPLLLLAVALVFFPRGLMLREYVQVPIRQWPTWQPVEIREGITETIVYLRNEFLGFPIAHRMLTNSHSMSSTLARDARYMKLFVYWPVAVHPDPKSALLISYGVGITAKALTDTRSLERIDFVDISRDVFELNRHVYPDPAEHPINDPRVTVHVEDGRFFLRATDRKFDLITGEPPPPKLAGVVALYTREYFALLRSRLEPGGIATYWLPVHNLTVGDAHAILAAFCDVFEDCALWAGSGLDWMMTGSNGATGPVSVSQFERQWRDPVVGPELRALGFERPEEFGALFMEGRDALLTRTRGIPPLTDDRPKRLSDRAEPWQPFLDWLDATHSRRLFRRDPDVARLFPAQRIASAAPWFEDEFRFERRLAQGVGGVDALREVDRWLTRSDRRTTPLWLLRSGWREVEAAKRASARGEQGAAVDHHLGAAALVERDYETAAAAFHRAGADPEAPRLAHALEVYALALAERWDEAEARARELRTEGTPRLDPFLRDVLARRP